MKAYIALKRLLFLPREVERGTIDNMKLHDESVRWPRSAACAIKYSTYPHSQADERKSIQALSSAGGTYYMILLWLCDIYSPFQMRAVLLCLSSTHPLLLSTRALEYFMLHTTCNRRTTDFVCRLYVAHLLVNIYIYYIHSPKLNG